MGSDYSVCITQYNDVRTVEKSITSVLEQFDSSFELVVVDNFSSDGSYQVLERLSASWPNVRLYRKKCSRGQGRQLAFLGSSGRYVISQYDTDDVMLPNLRSLLAKFHSEFEEEILRIRRSSFDGKDQFCGLTIARREVLSSIGGWRDLNWYEDADLWNRAGTAGLLVEIDYPIISRNANHPERRGWIQRIGHRYLTLKECERASLWNRVGVSEKRSARTFPLYACAWVAARFQPLRSDRAYPVHGSRS